MYNLTSPAVISEILEAHGFEFTKSLGQNFLIDQNIVDNIIQRADILDQNVLEVGPGIGAMTNSIAKVAKRVVAVEIDRGLKDILEDTVGHHDNLDIVYENILDVDITSLQNEYFDGESFKVVANLPYYITTPIISHLFTSGADITELIVMMQREVADRIVAPVGTREYGSISAFIRYFGDSEIILRVPPTVFMPRPKVESAVLKIDVKHKRSKEDLKEYESLLSAAFNQRRKTINNSISSGLNIEKPALRQVLEKVDIDPGLRAENLSMEDFERIMEGLRSE